MKHLKPILLLFLLWPAGTLLGQQDAAALNGLQGTQRVDALNRLAEESLVGRPAPAAEWAGEALELSEALNYEAGIAAAARILSIYERDQRRYGRATRLAEQSATAARRAGLRDQELEAYQLLQLIGQLRGRSNMEEEYREKYLRLKNELALEDRTEELLELAGEVATTSEALEDVEAQRRRIEEQKTTIDRERAAALDALELSEAERLRREAELARVEKERAELETEKSELARAAAEREVQLQRERNWRNMAMAGAGLLVLIIGFGWQRYRFVQQRRLAEIEKQRVQRLQEIDQLKDQFLANTSHELRTPLNGIIGLAESLYEDHDKTPAKVLKDNLAVIIAAGKRLNNLVNDILDFSRLKNAELSLRTRPLDLYSLTEIILRINQPSVRGKPLRLINAVPRDLPPVEADEDRLQQIMHNLVGNAIKFTESGTVKVSAHKVKGEVEIAVTDTGIGIPAAKQEAIFQAFQQGDGSTVREYSGAGLGLSITRYLVELHRGRIRVESTEGAGSSFYFTLPVATQAPPHLQAPDQRPSLVPLVETPELFKAPEEPQQPGAALPGNAGKVRLLVVDDEPINHHVLRGHLPPQHYEVTPAHSGQEALQLLESGTPFDLVLLDIMMPRMSGFEVCEKIREKYLPSELPVIMVTAKNQVRDMVQGLQTGANDYLAKPFTRDEFLARLKTQLHLHQINRATGRFVPSAFLRSLGRENITEVQLGDQVERDVTVLFSDIRDYTRLSESMTPEDNFRFVNAFNKRMGPIIDRHHGFINQYLGDAIMAIFLEQPVDALQAAIEIQEEIAAYNRQRKQKGRLPIRSGIGFHTGSLIMGIIGDDKRLDATTISDTVNTASRIENLNKYYGSAILLSQDSLQRIEGAERFRFRYLGQVQMKGKAVPVGIYECFDGDPPDIAVKKAGTLPLFKAGLQAYFARDFAAAARALEELMQVNPDDTAAQYYLNNALNLHAAGVPEGWTGVVEMKTK